VPTGEGMQHDRVTFATITWARTDEEDRLLRISLSELSGLGRPIMVADGGSTPDFRAFLRGTPNVTVVDGERPGVVGQVRSSLQAALATDAAFIVYTEPDKRSFFERSLRVFVDEAPEDERLGVAIAARDPASFATFPATQRATEAAINGLFAREVGIAADFCYGPLILNRDLVPRLSGLDPALGWGWRFYVMSLAQRAGYAIRVFEADLPCPPDQREDDLAERVHRLRQLSQNLQGVVLALQADVPET
jgi:hypothetical protein